MSPRKDKDGVVFETLEEFLARGGKIQKVALPADWTVKDLPPSLEEIQESVNGVSLEETLAGGSDE